MTSDYVDLSDDGTPNKVPPVLLNSTEKKAFDDNYEPCIKHMRGWIKQIQYEDLNMLQANMLFKSARNSPKLKGHSDEFVSRCSLTTLLSNIHTLSKVW